MDTYDRLLCRAIRYALKYKGIPFVTEWCEFTALPDKLKAAGAPPNSIKEDGTETYRTPTIIDDSTGKGVTESMIIAEYLDETYPDKPLLFPPGTAASMEPCFRDAIAPRLLARSGDRRGRLLSHGDKAVGCPYKPSLTGTIDG